MKKTLRKRATRGQRSLQLYSPCPCECSGCSGTPSWNYLNVRDYRDSVKSV